MQNRNLMGLESCTGWVEPDLNPKIPCEVNPQPDLNPTKEKNNS